jgi:hypothetical protein
MKGIEEYFQNLIRITIGYKEIIKNMLSTKVGKFQEHLKYFLKGRIINMINNFFTQPLYVDF